MRSMYPSAPSNSTASAFSLPSSVDASIRSISPLNKLKLCTCIIPLNELRKKSPCYSKQILITLLHVQIFKSFSIYIHTIHMVRFCFLDFVKVMVDPDAPNPSSPTLREYLHWWALNVIMQVFFLLRWDQVVLIFWISTGWWLIFPQQQMQALVSYSSLLLVNMIDDDMHFVASIN